MAFMVWEWIDRIQDLITLIGVPVAVYLLVKIYIRVSKK